MFKAQMKSDILLQWLNAISLILSIKTKHLLDSKSPKKNDTIEL